MAPVTPLKCFFPRAIPRFGAGCVLIVLFFGRTLLAQTAILPRDAAVREYEAGLQALKRKDFPTAIERLSAALATGHTRPAEGFGTSRYQLEWYDPYYWLGVASMELGDDSQARRYFTLSREGGVIEKRAEYADLLERMRLLDAREAARGPVPSPEPMVVAPTPALVLTPSPVESRRVPTTRPRPTAEAGATAPAPTRPGRPSLIPLIEAIAQARFGDAEVELAKVRAVSPDAAEPELLGAVLFGSRFVLEGSVDPSLLTLAKRSLAAYRRRGGSSRAEEAWLSPALRALLGG